MAHKFYITNNLGGGGTNVSRLIDYKQLFDLPNIGLLLNYYYLTGQARPRFDTNIINKINNYDNISDFLNDARAMFAKKRNVSDLFIQDLNPTKINGYMLDNGCGNILRDLLQTNNYSENSIQRIIVPFLDFAESLQFDFSIALDYAMKYTYKDSENQNLQMQMLWKELAGNEKINLSLIELTLKAIIEKGYKKQIYAPLHGFDYDSFSEYLSAIQEAENRLQTSFSGFALGGIADSRKLSNIVWRVPDNIKKELKTGFIVSKLCEAIRNKDNRPIHVLGAGNIYILPFIVKSGATSSDCHSAWRRASDGGYDKAKILIPLLNDELEFINDHDALKYIHIKDLNSSYNLNCKISINQLKQLYQSKGEDFYFAEIFTFYTAIKQYDLLIKYIDKHENYLNDLCHTPDYKFNTDYKRLIAALNY